MAHSGRRRLDYTSAVQDWKKKKKHKNPARNPLLVVWACSLVAACAPYLVHEYAAQQWLLSTGRPTPNRYVWLPWPGCTVSILRGGRGGAGSGVKRWGTRKQIEWKTKQSKNSVSGHRDVLRFTQWFTFWSSSFFPSSSFFGGLRWGGGGVFFFF